MDAMKMIVDEAKQLAVSFLGQPKPSEDYTYIILDEYTIERPKCFVFFYESSKFLKTDKFEDRLIGNSPILVDRINYDVVFLGSSKSVEVYIEEFEDDYFR